MGLFVQRKPKLNKQQEQYLKKQLNIDLSKFATKEDIEKYFNGRVASEQRKQLWASLSPNLKVKLLKYLQEKKEKNNARRK
jgi:diphthamide synthase (EF-2-diphthine--ammonia ligase)